SEELAWTEPRERPGRVPGQHLRRSLHDHVEGVSAAPRLDDHLAGRETRFVGKRGDPAEVALGETVEERHLLEESDASAAKGRPALRVLRGELPRERGRLESRSDAAHGDPSRSGIPPRSGRPQRRQVERPGRRSAWSSGMSTMWY